MMSARGEQSIGARAHPQIVQQYGLYNDQPLQQYIQQLGSELAQVSHRPELQYRFTLLDSPIINAFALPGGYVYITRGLLAHLNTRDQLAAILGHELGHVTARHAVRRHASSAVAGIGYTVGAILIPELGNIAARDLYSVVSSGILSGYGREHELEADRLGAIYLARASYDPEAVLDVLRVLKDQDEFRRQRAEAEGREIPGYHGLFATHPDNDTRLKSVVGTAAALATGGPRKNRDHAFLSRLDGLVFGDSIYQGIRRNNRFYHKELDITLRFPPQWSLENGAKQLVATAPSGGATMIMLSDARPDKLTPQQYLTDKLKLKPSGGERSLNSKLGPGYSMQAQITPRSGKTLARVSVRYLGKHAYIFLGVPKKEADLPLHDESFLAVAKSLRHLTKAEEKLATPLQIHLIKAGANTRFTALAKQSAITNYPEIQLRLLNQLYPEGEPKAGQQIKVIR